MRIDLRKLSTYSAFVGLVVAAWLLSACGSAESGTGGSADVVFQQVMDVQTTFTPEDLGDIGFKDVEELRSWKACPALPRRSSVSGASLPATRSITRSASTTVTLDAVELGTDLAEEGSGADAVLDDDDATYKEGVKDRRMIVGSGIGGGARSGIGPRYGGYAIYGNVIMLCGGAAGEQALERCELLSNALEEAAGQ